VVEDYNQMRKFIDLMETAPATPAPEITPVVEEPINVPDRLGEILFKIRAYSEPTGGEFSMGFESGLEMAAEMIEGLLNTMGETRGS